MRNLEEKWAQNLKRQHSQQLSSQQPVCLYLYLYFTSVQIVSLFRQAFYYFIKALFLEFMNGSFTINAAECLKLMT